jgi:glycosyltransferase involved in cell wall biosynthesis
MILEYVATRQTEKAQVLVGLVTCNSEAYLLQQVASIVNQVGVPIHTFIFDSGSTDKTIQILQEIDSSYPGLFSITLGDRMPPLDSFKELFSILPDNYPVALCDHDDLWDKHKVKRTLDFMVESGLDIVGTARSYINETNQVIGKSPKLNRGLSFENALIENVLYGNTILISAAAMTVTKNLSFSKAVMHDSYLYLYFSAFGKVGYLHEYLTEYRIHRGNTVGIKNRNLITIRKSIKSFQEQAAEFDREFAGRIPSSSRTSLRIHLMGFKSKNMLQNFFYTWRSPAYCQKWSKSIAHKCISMTIK